MLTDNQLDALLYPTIRQEPIQVPATDPAWEQLPRERTHSGLPAISAPVGFTIDGLPVRHGIPQPRVHGRQELWSSPIRGNRRPISGVPPATTPDSWSPIRAYVVTDGTATARLDTDGRRLRFVAPGMDTGVYLDPAMKVVKGVVRGEFRDDRWHVRYSIPTTAPGTATVDVADLLGGRRYVLHGTAVPH